MNDQKGMIIKCRQCNTVLYDGPYIDYNADITCSCGHTFKWLEGVDRYERQDSKEY